MPEICGEPAPEEMTEAEALKFEGQLYAFKKAIDEVITEGKGRKKVKIGEQEFAISRISDTESVVISTPSAITFPYLVTQFVIGIIQEINYNDAKPDIEFSDNLVCCSDDGKQRFNIPLNEFEGALSLPERDGS